MKLVKEKFVSLRPAIEVIELTYFNDSPSPEVVYDMYGSPHQAGVGETISVHVAREAKTKEVTNATGAVTHSSKGKGGSRKPNND
jgi:hypothetical protein